MIHLKVKQGSPEWIEARLGIPTASRLSDIYTASTRKPSKSQGRYLNELLAEYLTGEPSDNFDSLDADRGLAVEPEAIAYYELQREKVTPAGIILRDDRMAGASPDGLVGEDGLVEIKCLKAANHMDVLISSANGLPVKYYPQVQGQLMISERRWCDFLAWHHSLPPFLLRVERDEDYIAEQKAELDRFIGKMLTAREELKGRGYEPTY